MPRIESDDLIKCYPQLTADQVNLIKWFYTSFDNRAAANRRITNVEPFYFAGTAAGTEFVTYAATKLYICLSFAGSYNAVVADTNNKTVTFYNEANVAMFNYSNSFPVWDTAAASLKYYHNMSWIYNFYFSRLVLNAVVYITFNGFRITLV